VQTRVRRLRTKTADGEMSIVLETSRAESGPDRANLNAWLSQRASVTVRSVGPGRSCASSRSECGGGSAAATSGSAHASVQGAASDLETGERG
jgi:hypothetical protein